MTPVRLVQDNVLFLLPQHNKNATAFTSDMQKYAFKNLNIVI